MSVITSADLPALTDNVRREFTDAPPEFTPVRQQYLDVQSTKYKVETESNNGEVETAARWVDGGQIDPSAIKPGFDKEYNQGAVAKKITVSWQMRQFDTIYGEIAKRTRGIKKAAVRRMEMDGAASMSYAWSTSYENRDGETVDVSGADGSAFITASHTTNTGGVTWSNQLTGNHSPIGETTLENLAAKFNGFVDEADGRAVPRMGTDIISSDHAPTCFEIARLLKSNQQSGTDNNDINVHKGQYNHIKVPYIRFDHATEQWDTDKDRYVFLCNLQKDVNGFIWKEKVALDVFAPERVNDNEDWQYSVAAMYDFGLIRSNFGTGTKGDGSAV